MVQYAGQEDIKIKTIKISNMCKFQKKIKNNGTTDLEQERLPCLFKAFLEILINHSKSEE